MNDDGPRFAAALSTLENTATAAREACRQATARLGGQAHLAIVFASFNHQEQFDRLAETLHQELGGACLLGCTGESIACNAQEIEGSSAIALWLAHLPGVTLRPMHLEFQPTPEGGAIVGWPDELLNDWPPSSDGNGATLLLLGEPFSFPADVLAARLNQDHPDVAIVGGMASGGWSTGQNRVLLNAAAYDSGAVAVLVSGPVRVRTVVSQGCRPIGQPFIVTKAERNVIFELGGKPALVHLQELFPTLTPEEQQMARGGLHVGQVINEYQDKFGRGDFLVRNVQGVDPETGAVAIGDYVRVGQTVQFHVRDARTADEDLNALLGAAKAEAGDHVRGALLFTCNGRGTRLFEQPHHDAATLEKYWPSLPVAGFFAQGEIGPIGEKCFVHGFTASIALFEKV